MKERIFGTECEYALSLRSAHQAAGKYQGTESLLEYRKSLAAALLSGLKQTPHAVAGEFLGNGGRIYIDRGGHPEYATPECRSVTDLVAYEKAGDRIFCELAKKIPGLYVYKNNVDYHGTTYGGHENYLIEPGVMENIRRIIPFLITRQIFCGAGKVCADNPEEEFPYQLSQRADYIHQVFSDRTSGVRGIINIRKREIAAPGKNRRLHIIFGDSNMSQHAIRLKIGTTALLLRVLEESELDQVPAVLSPVESLKQISKNIFYLMETEEKGRKYHAVDIQKMYYEQALKFYQIHPPDSEESEILSQWEDMLGQLETLKISLNSDEPDEEPPLGGKIDWALKLWLINRTRCQLRVGWEDKRLKYLDLNYHNLDPEVGVFNRCEQAGVTVRTVDEAAVAQAVFNPPGGTRARIRGNIIKEAWNKPVDVHIQDWENIRICPAGKTTGVVHPFHRYARKYDALHIRLDDPLFKGGSELMDSVKNYIHQLGNS